MDQPGKTQEPLVSICSITYNHAPYIRQCLDGFLMQETDFPVEIIINDDCSTDGTTEIIREYAEKYPDRIFPVFHEENLFSQKVRGMFQKFVFPKARGKYIALCEGDDYWTNPGKLQQQVDFLETHPEFSLCFHKVGTLCEGQINRTEGFDFLEEREYSPEEIIRRWSIPTCSVLFLKKALKIIPENKNFKFGDNILFLSCAQIGKLFCMEDEMGVYRRHAGGWTNNKGSIELITNLIIHTKAQRESFPAALTPVFNDVLAGHYLWQIRLYKNLKNWRAFTCFCRAIVDCKSSFFAKLAESTQNKYITLLLSPRGKKRK